MPEGDLPTSSLPQSRGILDRDSGLLKAAEARVRLVRFAAKALPTELDFGVPHMTLMTLLTRAHAFHDGALEAIRQDNPFAAFTLIRSYAENAAILVRLTERPAEIARLYPDTPKDQQLRIGQIAGAAGSRLGQFKGVYEQLSGFAHPTAATALSGWHGVDDDSTGIRWQSKPSFKNDADFMMACFWLVELAEANAHLWRECFEMYFGSAPTAAVPKWDRPTI